MTMRLMTDAVRLAMVVVCDLKAPAVTRYREIVTMMRYNMTPIMNINTTQIYTDRQTHTHKVLSI